MTINSGFSNQFPCNNSIIFNLAPMTDDDSDNFSGWKEYPKKYVTGDFFKYYIRKCHHGVEKKVALKLRDKIWGIRDTFSEESHFHLLHTLWEDKDKGPEYLKNSIYCVLHISEYSSLYSLRCIDLIEAVTSKSNQEVKDLLIATFEDNVKKFAIVFKGWVINFSKFSEGKGDILNRFAKALSFLRGQSPKLYNCCLRTHIEQIMLPTRIFSGPRVENKQLSVFSCS